MAVVKIRHLHRAIGSFRFRERIPRHAEYRCPPSSLYKQINRAIGKGLRLKRLQQSLFLAEGEASKDFLITLLDDEGASKVEVMGKGEGGEGEKESPRISESELMDDLISKVLSDPIITKALGKSRDAKGMSRLIEMIEGMFEKVS